MDARVPGGVRRLARRVAAPAGPAVDRVALAVDRVRAADQRQQFAAMVVVLAAVPLVTPSYQLFLLSEVLVLAILATAFNLLYGYTGLLSFGHAMFVAVSGYTVARLVIDVAPALGAEAAFGGATPLVLLVAGLVAGTVAAVLVAVPVGYFSVQLKEIYFAMITLSFSMAIYVVANQNIGGLTNGSDGLSFILGTADLFGLELSLIDPAVMYALILVVFLPVTYALWRVVRSPFGVVCRAIRENPERAEALGIDVTRHSWATFVISGAFSGLAGALLIPLRTNINPGVAHWSSSAEPVIVTVIGGPYSFLGPLVGSFTYTYLRELISTWPVLEANWQFAFGVLLLLVVLFFDNGVAGGLEVLGDRLEERAERARDGGEPE